MLLWSRADRISLNLPFVDEQHDLYIRHWLIVYVTTTHDLDGTNEFATLSSTFHFEFEPETRTDRRNFMNETFSINYGSLNNLYIFLMRIPATSL